MRTLTSFWSAVSHLLLGLVALYRVDRGLHLLLHLGRGVRVHHCCCGSLLLLLLLLFSIHFLFNFQFILQKILKSNVVLQKYTLLLLQQLRLHPLHLLHFPLTRLLVRSHLVKIILWSEYFSILCLFSWQCCFIPLILPVQCTPHWPISRSSISSLTASGSPFDCSKTPSPWKNFDLKKRMIW